LYVPAWPSVISKTQQAQHAQHSTAQHSTAQHSTAQHSTAQHTEEQFEMFTDTRPGMMQTAIGNKRNTAHMLHQCLSCSWSYLSHGISQAVPSSSAS